MHQIIKTQNNYASNKFIYKDKTLLSFNNVQ